MLQLKKRIVGFLLLSGLLLIAIPLFFGHSIPADELKLSGHVPSPPPKLDAISMPLPPQSATVPAIVTAPKPTAPATENPSVAFNQLQSDISPKVEDTSPLQTTTQTPVNTPAPVVADPAPTPAVAPVRSAPSLPNVSNQLASSAQSVVTTEPPAVQTTSEVVTQPTKKAKVLPSPRIETKSTAPLKKTNVVENTADSHPSKTSKKPSAHIPSAAEAWSVQLGYFSVKTNAEKLMRQLQSHGFNAYLQTNQTTKGNFVRVLVGPHLRRSDAQQLQVRIQKELQMQGMLVKVGRMRGR